MHSAAVPNPLPAILVVAHRGAGAGRAGRAAAAAMVRFADLDLPAELLVAADHTALARAARGRVAGGIRALVVVGGDGMVALGVNVAATAGVPLGVVPAGSGNDFARSAGIPRGDAGAAVDRIADGERLGPLPVTVEVRPSALRLLG